MKLLLGLAVGALVATVTRKALQDPRRSSAVKATGLLPDR